MKKKRERKEGKRRSEGEVVKLSMSLFEKK